MSKEKKAPTLNQENDPGKNRVRPSPPPEIDIRDLENAIPYSVNERKIAVAYLVKCQEFLTKEEHIILQDLIPRPPPPKSLEIDLKNMMQEQMAAARSLKDQFFTREGKFKLTADPKEAREALRGAQLIIEAVFKLQDKIDIATKLSVMEQSLLSVSQELPPELQEKFFARVERILGDK